MLSSTRVPGLPRALGLAAGYALDRIWGDPQRWHPVAGFGSAALALERSSYRDSRTAGSLHTLTLTITATAGATITERWARRSGPVASVVVTAIATWAALGGSSLSGVGREMAGHLEREDLASARALLPSLCGRDPSLLDADGLARAALESVAENTSDATVGVLVWGAIAGVPGVVAYRASNTLDAMIGYKSARYLRFGWAAARIDDIVNLVPSRVTGALTVVAAPVIGGSAASAMRAWRRDASSHPSPNAGVAEAAAAGALGVRLGGVTRYGHGVEIRPTLGDGRHPTTRDLGRAVVLSTRVQEAATVLSAVLAVAVGQMRGGRRPGRRRARG